MHASCESITYQSQKLLQTDLEKLGWRIRHHEHNLKLLNTRSKKLNISIHKIHESTPAATFRHEIQRESSKSGVLGAVGTLGLVISHDLNRTLSEYLGPEIMPSIVCKTREAARSLKDDSNHKNVICSEDLRDSFYRGDYITGDPQKRLEMLKPTLPSGKNPTGFLGFAVNMIDINTDTDVGGHCGLRESLFYHLFSTLQVYRTKSNLQKALPFTAKGGAVSLDGGTTIEKNARMFAVSSGPPPEIVDAKEQMKCLNWEKERVVEDLQREEGLLCNYRKLFDVKKQEFLENLVEVRRQCADTSIELVSWVQVSLVYPF